jgi:hypothetical protein
MRKPIATALLFALVAAGAPAQAREISMPQAPQEKKDSEKAPKSKNLLSHIGNPFAYGLPKWDQRHLLNDTAYGTLLALSIDASICYNKPIVLDPDSTTTGPISLKGYIDGLNHRGYLEYWKNPFYQVIMRPGKERHPFHQIDLLQIPNDENTKGAIKAALDNNQAVIFTYNYLKGHTKGTDEFFRMKFNLKEGEAYNDESSYDSLYDGEHTMCIVGYDDKDQIFIVQDSRNVSRKLALPGLTHVSSNNGTIKIPQDLGYTGSFYKSNGITGAHRHEFFTLKTSWVKGDAQAPQIKDIKLETINAQEKSQSKAGHYIITASVTDNVKIADRVNTTVTTMEGREITLYGVYENGAMAINIPILDADSMSAPMWAAIKMSAKDTSGNEAMEEQQHYFQYGLPLYYFHKAYGPAPAPVQTLAQTLAQAQKNASGSPGLSNAGMSAGPYLWPQANLYAAAAPVNLVDTYIKPIFAASSSYPDTFFAENWNQASDTTCVAHATIAALSVMGNIDKGYGAVCGPNRYTNKDDFPHNIPEFVTKLDGQKQLFRWEMMNGNTVSYPFYKLGIARQMPHNDSARQLIKMAINNGHPVAFRFRYWGNDDGKKLKKHWSEEGENAIFTAINDGGLVNSYDDNRNIQGHAMCIVGYEGDDTFIVQNSWGTNGSRPNGILKLPQNLPWDKVHAFGSFWPLNTISKNYRLEFYELYIQWSKPSVPTPMPDTMPPEIWGGDMEFISHVYIGDTLVSIYPFITYSVTVTDDVKVASVSATLTLPDQTPINLADENNGYTWKFVLPVNWAMEGSVPWGLITITATDTSGNVTEESFYLNF